MPALEKALDIMEALAASPAPQTLADLVRSLDRRSSGLFRLMDTLDKRDCIVRDAATGG